MSKDINQLLDWTPSTDLAALPMVGSDEHRLGMRSFAAGVSIISALDGQARLGLTATAVCSVTVDPPRLVVFVNKRVAASQAILDSGALCVNVLSGEQEHMAKVFAGMVEGVHGEARFEHGRWREMVTGVPVLEAALANFDCRVIKVFDESTHNAFLCEVLATAGGQSSEPLIYLNGAFRRLAPLTS
ncbi:FMN reductase (NADH) RutF [compost metagenome]